MTDGRCVTNAASAARPGDDPEGEQKEITAALADAGAEILRALVVVSDRGSRRRHIANARRLLSIAYGSGPDEQG